MRKSELLELFQYHSNHKVWLLDEYEKPAANFVTADQLLFWTLPFDEKKV